MSNVENGQTVNVHYKGTLDDGTEFDNSHNRGEPLSFQVGSGQVISGFDTAVSEMTVGESKTIRLEAGDAYGEINPNAQQEMPLEAFPEDFEFKIGSTVVGKNQTGQQMMAKVETITDKSVTLDFNHPLAGEALTFELELMSVD